MIIKKIELHHLFSTNGYFFIDEKTKHGFLIDPASQADKLIKIIKDNDWVIEKILLTHGHFDHIGAVEALNKELNIPFYIHKFGKEYLKNPHLNLSDFTGDIISFDCENLLEDGDIINLNANNDVQLKVIHTPGHTPCSAIFYSKKDEIAFVGDTIFKSSVGSTEYPGGDVEQLRNSIFNKVFLLPDNTILYSGHTDETTIRAEKDLYNV